MSAHPIQRWVSLLALCSITLLAAPAPGRADSLPTVLINGQVLDDPLTRVVAGRLLVPLRAVATGLGATVNWNEAERRVTVQGNGHTVDLWIDAQTARVDGTLQQLDAAPQIVANRTLIPYRFLGTSLGAQVGWEDGLRVAWLRSAPAVPSSVPSPAGASAGGPPASGAPAPRQVLRTLSGYTVITGDGDQSSLHSVQANGSKLTDIATVSHQFKADGSLVGVPQTEIMAAAVRQGIHAWLVVQNLDAAGNFSPALAGSVLHDPAAEQRFATQLLAALKAGGFVGVEIDFEFLDPAWRPDFTRFLQGLHPTLAAGGFRLSVAVPAEAADAPSDGWSGAYDYPQIGQIADRISLMTYDEHWFGGASGPIASLPWVDSVLRYATQTMPADKLLLGVAFYAYDWSLAGGPAQALADTQAAGLAQIYGAGFDAASASPFIRYADASHVSHMVWYEDAASLQSKVDLAAHYGLQGVNIWRLGLDGPAQWQGVAAAARK